MQILSLVASVFLNQQKGRMTKQIMPWLISAKVMRPITKTHLFKYIENFTTKNGKFLDKNSDIFHISAQNIDCGYWLELPRRGSSNIPQSIFLSRNKKNNEYPCKPQFYYIKVGFKGVRIISVCFRDASGDLDLQPLDLHSGPSCSKLMTSLVNNSLKFT